MGVRFTFRRRCLVFGGLVPLIWLVLMAGLWLMPVQRHASLLDGRQLQRLALGFPPWLMRETVHDRAGHVLYTHISYSLPTLFFNICASLFISVIVGYICGLNLQRLIRGDYCDHCGYSLKHHTTNRCPECGQPVQPLRYFEQG